MKNIPSSSALFKDIDSKHFAQMLSCVGAVEKRYHKDEIVLMAGERPTHVGVILAGHVHILHECLDGSSFLVGALEGGGIIGGALVCADVSESPVSVRAKAKSLVLLIDFACILNACRDSCPHKLILQRNMMRHVASQSLQLQKRLEIVSIKSVRTKILRYLGTFADHRDITVPFNRQDMADYLCVERSALSRELAKMKQDGLIDYRKNKFTLKSKPS